MEHNAYRRRFVPYRDGRLLCSGRVCGVGGEEIHRTVNGLVPARVRDSLFARRERYARDYRRP